MPVCKPGPEDQVLHIEVATDPAIRLQLTLKVSWKVLLRAPWLQCWRWSLNDIQGIAMGQMCCPKSCV